MTVADDDPRLAVEFKSRECYTAEGHRKQTYSRVEAKARARRMGKQVKAYRCGICGWWHCGNKPEAPRSAP